MKYCGSAFLVLLLLAVLTAGCTEGPAPGAAPLPAAGTPPAAGETPKPVFTLGQEYFHTKHSFMSETDVISEQFRVTTDPWAIDFTINPTNTDPQYTWFEITATNIDTGQSETYGYGRSYPLDRHQQYPMYNAGPYRFDLKGNRVIADVTIAKRNA